MSKVGHLPKTVPSKELSFQFKGTGNTYNVDYEGHFVVKVPGVRELSRHGIELARLNAGVRQEHLDNITATLNNALAALRVFLIECPDWFKEMDYGLDTDDYNIPIEIFQEADRLISEWRDSLQGNAEDDKKSS